MHGRPKAAIKTASFYIHLELCSPDVSVGHGTTTGHIAIGYIMKVFAIISMDTLSTVELPCAVIKLPTRV